jgi:hypothetical protein
MGRVDFTRDFVDFVRDADFKFVDVSPPPFDRFRFSSKFARPDVSVVERFVMPYLPLRIAVARADFVPEGPDELPLKKGKYVYLMQQPKNGWVFAMTRAYGKYGFVPSQFVDVRGVGIAVVLREAPGYIGRVGAMLVLLGGGDEAVTCEDFHGKKINLSRAAVAIL